MREQHLPLRQSMRAGHKVRRFRRGNSEHRGSWGHKQKPWKQQSVRSAA
jgi:hypothetical protein